MDRDDAAGPGPGAEWRGRGGGRPLRRSRGGRAPPWARRGGRREVGVAGDRWETLDRRDGKASWRDVGDGDRGYKKCSGRGLLPPARDASCRRGDTDWWGQVIVLRAGWFEFSGVWAVFLLGLCLS